MEWPANEAGDQMMDLSRGRKRSGLPPPELDAIAELAHTFNGYEFAGSLEACSNIAQGVRRRFHAGEPFGDDLDELRAALFFAHRAQRHQGLPFDEATEAYVRALAAEIRLLLAARRRELDTRHSSFREKMLEHVFVSELLQEAWFGHGRTIEVLRAEVDAEGYDLVVEFDGVLRHVQLKSSHADARTARQNISTRLAQKPSGCVVWIFYREVEGAGRITLTYRFFGGPAGEPLPDLGDAVVRHTKGDATGAKSVRPAFRAVNKGAFSAEVKMDELFRMLFGKLGAAGTTEAE